jgi:high affinity Mn2+ porin
MAGILTGYRTGYTRTRQAAMGDMTMAGFVSARRWAWRGVLAAGLVLAAASTALAQSDAAATDEDYAFHGQVTFVEQFHPGFTSPYRGGNSLDSGSRGMETVAATFFAGFRVWDGGQLYIDPEVDQGFGLSDTFGIAAFPSGEAYKVGSSDPYGRLQQIFFRQVIGLGGGSQSVDPAANQLGMTQSTDNITITLGKFGVTSVFDTNAYAHDPSSDFLNWALIDAGAFDYAADAWGYTYGASVEWTQSWWTLRSGFFAMSRLPNGKELQTDFTQFEVLDEAEARLDLFGKEGKFKLLGFLNRARMGSYDDAVNLAIATHSIPDTALVQKYNSRPGFSLNVEQPVTDDLGAFLRVSFNNGEEEAYEFTEINQSVSGGVSLKGTRWGRDDDTVGIAGLVDGISQAARRYFAAGGLGTLIGDGQLPHYATENIAEIYYSVQAAKGATATLDYQFVANPAYNADRGPVSIIAVRLHASI